MDKKLNCNIEVCKLCGKTQDKHKTNMHIFGIQIGCSLGDIKQFKDKDLTNKPKKKTAS
tara:strand:+ start:450 stop:626 length:177 start_codon:yes stop_codon:yes gene_type:complete